MSKNDHLIPVERISSKIFYIRNEKVLLDFDLAELYGVETRTLKQAVRRNINRFPKDFMFQITKSEWNELITVCDNLGDRKFNPRPPFTFTEQSVAMLSSVLNSDRAVKVNIAIMRAFVKMRKILESNESLAKKLKQLEKETKEKFAEHQQQIGLIFETIKELVTEKEKPKRRIGF
jgi:hypothetical protein